MSKYLSMILDLMYPDAEPDIDYQIGRREDGTYYISYWDTAKLGPQPSEAELKAQELPAVKMMKRREIRLAANDAYDRLFMLDGTVMNNERDFIMRQESKALAGKIVLAPAGAVQTKIDQMDALRTKQTNRLQLVNGAATVSEVEAIVAW